MDFLSINNFKLCGDIFCKYMEDEYGLRVIIKEDDDMKKTMFNVMRQVQNSSQPNANLKSLNNAVLNEMRDVCLAKYNMSSGASRKPRLRSLEREQDVYGARQLELGEHIKPSMNPPRRDDAMHARSIDDIRTDRENALNNRSGPGSGGQPQAQALPFEVVKVPEALSAKDFEKQLVETEKRRLNSLPLPTGATTNGSQQPFQSQGVASLNAPGPIDIRDMAAGDGAGSSNRMSTSIDIATFQRSTFDNDPKQMYAASMTAQDRKSDVEEAIMRAQPYKNFNQDALIAPSKEQMDKKTYILFNGYDRKWDLYPHRYDFTIDINDVTKSIKNITEISFTRLIIPMEVLQIKKTTTQVSDAPPYYNQYGLTYPYLMLQIDQLSPGMYEGFNKTTQKCFTSFVFHREYRASNGRGFIIMQPLQGEKKEYQGAPLGNLPRLSIRVVKPNGTLYNMARDENRIDSFLYETLNPLLIKVLCKDFFDANEFAMGDVVRIQEYRMMTPAEFAAAVVARGQGPVTSSELGVYTSGVLAIEDFMNRDEGHEIIMTGNPNQNTFMNNFSIYLPRKLDKTQGALVLQKDIFDAINVCQKYLSGVPHSSIGRLMNMTLQVVLTMKVKTTNSDVSQVIRTINI